MIDRVLRMLYSLFLSCDKLELIMFENMEHKKKNIKRVDVENMDGLNFDSSIKRKLIGDSLFLHVLLGKCLLIDEISFSHRLNYKEILAV